MEVDDEAALASAESFVPAAPDDDVDDLLPGRPEKAKLMLPRLPEAAKSSFMSLLLMYLLIEADETEAEGSAPASEFATGAKFWTWISSKSTG